MGNKSRVKKCLPENRGVFKNETTTTATEWAIMTMRRGWLASAVFGSIALLVGVWPYAAIVALLCGMVSAVLWWWLILDNIWPVDDSVNGFNKHIKESRWPSDWAI